MYAVLCSLAPIFSADEKAAIIGRNVVDNQCTSNKVVVAFEQIISQISPGEDLSAFSVH